MVEPITRYDYIIVGAGSAGCVLANRLSADPRNSVLLIEAGGDDRPMHNLRRFIPSTLIHLPVGFARNMFDPEMTWGYESEPAPAANNRRFSVIRGRVLGGCSAINAMLYVRGESRDYEEWAEAGCPGWGWDAVLPYFRRAETMDRPADQWHGGDGPLNVITNTLSPSVDKAFETAEMLGIPRAESFFSGTQLGSGATQLTIRNGRRQSTAVAYLNPARSRANLHIVSDTQVLGIVFDKRRALGVKWKRGDTQGCYEANREIILAAGAIGSPRLLELSGIGSAQRLSALGIEPIVDLPGVGEYLQDHYYSSASARLENDQPSANVLGRPPRIFLEMFKYLLFRRGLLCSSAVQGFIYACSSPEMSVPDLQFSLTAASIDAPRPGSKELIRHTWPGMTIASSQVRPYSRGYVHINSADPNDHPTTQLAFLDDERDQAAQLAGLKLARALISHPNMSSCVVSETAPGADVQTDGELLDFIRATGGSIHHPVGSVRMGGGDAPLDERLRVRGVHGLRVVDASIMPNLVSGNTNGPTIMIAEKGSDMILEEARNA